MRQVEDLSPIHTARSTALLCTSSTAQYCAALHGTAQYGAVPCSAAQYGAASRPTARRCGHVAYVNVSKLGDVNTEDGGRRRLQFSDCVLVFPSQERN